MKRYLSALVAVAVLGTAQVAFASLDDTKETIAKQYGDFRMQQHDIVVTVDLGVGSAEATVWTCDFSYEYVKINGEYHT